MVIFRQLLALSALLFWSGCEGCGQKAPLKEQAAPLSQEDLAKFFIDPPSLFSKTQHFSFKSDITMSLGKGESTETSQELIEIVGEHPRMHLKKKIDDLHFIELFSDGRVFFTKSQDGAFRNASENKHMYQSLWKDGFNGIAWFIEEFALGDRLVKEKNNGAVFVVNNVELRDAPFMKNLTGFTPEEIESTSLSGRIVLDEKTNLPISGKFDVLVMGKSKFFIKIVATQSLDFKSSGKKLLLPETSGDEPIEIPVNITSRFNELMHSHQGGTP